MTKTQTYKEYTMTELKEMGRVIQKPDSNVYMFHPFNFRDQKALDVVRLQCGKFVLFSIYKRLIECEW